MLFVTFDISCLSNMQGWATRFVIQLPVVVIMIKQNMMSQKEVPKILHVTYAATLIR